MKRFFALLCICFFSATSLAATTINKIVIFGDSLSDTGNLYLLSNYTIPKNPPYFQGRFSNGPVWIESLVRQLGFNITAKNQVANYAYAGAWATDSPPSTEMALVNLSWEISEFIELDAPYGISPKTLVIVWIGGNDYLSGRYDTSPENATSVSIHSIEKSLELLMAQGAKHFLILNLPDLGTTPRATSQNAQIAARISLLSHLHNQKLTTMLSTMRTRHADVQLLELDLVPHFTDVLAHPGKYHITNTKDACYDGDYGFLDGNNNAPYHLCSNPNEYIYWDYIHPTQAMHATLAKVALDFLAKNHIEAHP